MTISKSDYLLYLKHPAWLWLKKRAPKKLPPPDERLERVFARGHAFEKYAESLFPDGITLGFATYNEYLTLPDRTKAALGQGADTVFQGRFDINDLTCIVDILVRVDEQTYDLIEIKSSSRAKADHIPDLAFQAIVLEDSGYAIASISVMHVNSEYVRDGAIEAAGLVTRTDVTTEVRVQIPETRHDLANARELLTQTQMPDLSPRLASSGGLRDWLSVYEHLKGPFDPHSVYRLTGRKIDQLTALEDAHISQIADIPDDFGLTPKQGWQVAATKQKKRIINREKIRAFLDSLVFPLYFLDYETLGDLIPAFDGMRPYQQIPFQYSLHRMDEPGGTTQHTAFLHQENSNPGNDFSRQLMREIGLEGRVLTWNERFEKGINTIVGEMLPDYKEFYENLNNRIDDLMMPFARGWFVDKDFFGSASIKNVQPVLAPEMAYKGLAIGNGEDAQRMWMETFLDNHHAQEREKTVKDLLTYCRYDTAVMVKIYEELVKSV